jgi:DNA transposition AAA+ family ATPase
MVTPSPLSPELQEHIDRLKFPTVLELASVTQFHEWLDDQRECRQSGRVIGDSGTGKSIACNAYTLKSQSDPPDGTAPTLPVLSISALTEMDQRQVFVSLLEQLNYRITKGPLSDLRERVYWLLTTCQVEMILIDEAHRCRPRALSEIRDIAEKLRIAVILIGTDRLETVMGRDEQVKRRFLACHRFHRLDSQALADMSTLWETYVLRLPQPSHLTRAPIQKILGAATSGYLGPLDEILRKAARRALRSGHPRIELSHLNHVIKEHRYQ